MNSKIIYYVNTSVIPDLQEINQSVNYYRNEPLTNPNISFDQRNITHQIENQKFPNFENLAPINYFFRRDGTQSSLISENSNNYQYSKTDQKPQLTKLKKTSNITKDKYDFSGKKNITNVKKNENIFSNQQQKENQHPINYVYYESKYTKKKSNIENQQQNDKLKTNNNINNNIIKSYNSSKINSQYYGKTISDLNLYRFSSGSNNDLIEKEKENYTTAIKSSRLISKKNTEKKKNNNSYINSDFFCFSPLKQELENSSFIRENNDIFTQNNQSFSIISKNRSKNKLSSKVSRISKKKLIFQTEEKEDKKKLFDINEDIKGIKFIEINNTDPKESNSKTNKNKSKCQNFDLELKNFGANSQAILFGENNRNKSETITFGENNRNKSYNISNKRANSNNFVHKATGFNKLSKIVSTHKNDSNNKNKLKTEVDINQNRNVFIRDRKLIENDGKYSYENINKPNNENIHNENEKNKFIDNKFDTKKNNFRPTAKDHTISNKKINNKENERIKNKYKIDENITLKKNISSKTNPFDSNKSNNEINKTLNNKKKLERKRTNKNLITISDTTINKNKTKNNTINTTKKTPNSQKYLPNTTEPKSNHTFYEPSSTENLNQYSRLTISNSKIKSKNYIQNNTKRSPSNFAKYESFPSNQKEDEWDKIQYMGMRKSTYDPGKRGNKKNDINDINSKFSSTNYIKFCEAVSIPGKNEHGFKKTNQDTYLVERNINGILNFNIFGVLDGHGKDGHFASQFVSRYIIYRIKNHPKIKYLDEPNEIYHIIKENGYKIIANIFIDADNQIQKEKFDFYKSGTTCVIVIQLEEHLICANAGDSRAILIFDENYDDNLINSKIFCLSYDCKPDLPLEKKRIYEYGGTVEKAIDENNEETGPYRVWKKNEDYPGLAMSRSIGDIEAKKVGVIPNPQIVEYTLNYYSKYMIICSDGVWEFIDNERVMNIGNKYYLRNDPSGLCQELIQTSVDYWLNEDVVVDDITVVSVFF